MRKEIGLGFLLLGIVVVNITTLFPVFNEKVLLTCVGGGMIIYGIITVKLVQSSATKGIYIGLSFVALGLVALLVLKLSITIGIMSEDLHLSTFGLTSVIFSMWIMLSGILLTVDNMTRA